MFDETIKIGELVTIKRDSEILRALCLKTGPNFAPTYLPYVSLFCNESIQYLNNDFSISTELQNSGKYFIKNVRNKIKIFDNNLNRTINIVMNIDKLQNDAFAAQCKSSLLRHLNIYKNLGVTFDSQRHILMDSQYIYFLLQDNRILKKAPENIHDLDYLELEVLSEDVHALGYNLGQIIGSVSEGFSDFADNISCEVCTDLVIATDKDFNTNKIFSNNNEKAICLLLLHILTNVNYALYYLKQVILIDNGWLLRAEYISYYYAHKKLNAIKSLCGQNKDCNWKAAISKALDKCNLTDESLIDTNFRNCMMHYRYRDDSGIILIKEDCYDSGQPLCGLVDSLFPGKSYLVFRQLVENQLEIISETLSKYLNIYFGLH